VALTGFSFQLSRNETDHEMFHVTGVSVKDSHLLPVVTSHSVTLVSGRHSFSWGNGEVKPFPVEIETGMRTIENDSGFQEHIFNVYLKEGKTISVSVNATKAIDFSFNTGYGYRGFGGDHEDYIALGSNVVEVNLTFTAEKTGSHFFGIRGYGGATGTVIFDCKRLP
jgi:hypothetical protein